VRWSLLFVLRSLNLSLIPNFCCIALITHQCGERRWFTLVTSVHSLNDNAVESFGAESGTARPCTPRTHRAAELTGPCAEELASKKSRYKLDKSELSEHSGFSLDLLSTTSMEIDPHRIDDASDTTINSLELWLAAQKLFKCIVDSEKIIPTQIKQLMRHIDSEVGAKYDAQAQFRSMGGFLFLRMLCPALMAPQVYGLLDSPPHPVSPPLTFFVLFSSLFVLWVGC